jgi:hypothetical protein
VVTGILAGDGMAVHIEAHVGALCFVSRQVEPLFTFTFVVSEVL